MTSLPGLGLSRVALAAGMALLGLAGTAQALPSINLTDATYNGIAASTSGTITNALGSVIFTRDAVQPAGTGVFNPFLRLDVKGNRTDEQGYNTSATITEGPKNNQTTRKILDNMSPENWTHDVLISDLSLTADGLYYEFKLDINEPGNANSLLSLDGLKLFSTSQPSQSTETLNGRGDLAGLANATLLWDMDLGATGFGDTYPDPPNNDPLDKSVLLDAKLDKGPGSGVSDMLMLVEKSVIDAAAAGQNYLVLWSRFGLEQAANTGSTDADAGFEEWAYRHKPTGSSNGGGGSSGGQVPTPASSALTLLGLAMMGATLRSRKAAARKA